MKDRQDAGLATEREWRCAQCGTLHRVERSGSAIAAPWIPSHEHASQASCSDHGTPRRLSPSPQPTQSPQDALFELLAEALVELALCACLEAEAEPVYPQPRA
jgi:hypothetical protein